MTRATITIKRKDGVFDQLWHVNSDGYPEGGLGEEIFANLKTVNDIERAIIIFRKADCFSRIETSFTIGETDNIQNIIKQYNDYSYVFDEETGKWEYYFFDEGPYDLEEALKKEEEEEEDDRN